MTGALAVDVLAVEVDALDAGACTGAVAVVVRSGTMIGAGFAISRESVDATGAAARFAAIVAGAVRGARTIPKSAALGGGISSVRSGIGTRASMAASVTDCACTLNAGAIKTSASAVLTRIRSRRIPRINNSQHLQAAPAPKIPTACPQGGFHLCGGSPEVFPAIGCSTARDSREFAQGCYSVATGSNVALSGSLDDMPSVSSLRYNVDRPIRRRRATSDIWPR